MSIINDSLKNLLPENKSKYIKAQIRVSSQQIQQIQSHCMNVYPPVIACEFYCMKNFAFH